MDWKGCGSYWDWSVCFSDGGMGLFGVCEVKTLVKKILGDVMSFATPSPASHSKWGGWREMDTAPLDGLLSKFAMITAVERGLAFMCGAVSLSAIQTGVQSVTRLVAEHRQRDFD